MIEFLHKLLFVGTAEMIGALVVLVLIRAKHNLNLGPLRRVNRGSNQFQLLILPALLGLCLTLLLHEASEPVRYLPGLVAAAACLILQPRPGSSALGAAGVRTGWRSSKFEELDGWRLTGDHLRVQIDGHWGAVEVPAVEHESLRAQLEGLCPESESRFRV